MKKAIVGLFVTVFLVMPFSSFAGSCGDVDNSDAINILDVTYLVNYLYKSGPDPDCGTSYSGICGDVDNSGTINILDVTYLINYLYKGGPEPDCGETTGTVTIDPSPDALNAPWSLAGPNSYTTPGTGDATLPDLEPGEYTITWGTVAGWITPSNSTQTLPEDGTITFTGTYEEEGSGTVTDIDGNVYQTIKIGDQWWMMENLKVTHYRNGDPIPHVTDNGAWSDLTTGAYCEYDNNPSYVATYGRLYNWFAVDDNRNIAPEGWHVPTDAEWKQLEMYLGMSQAEADATGFRGTDEGGKLKETGTTHWSSPNTGATNESGFTALPGGYRNNLGSYYNMGYDAIFWTSTEYDDYYAWRRALYYDYSVVRRSTYYNSESGYSVRCVRD